MKKYNPKYINSKINRNLKKEINLRYSFSLFIKHRMIKNKKMNEIKEIMFTSLSPTSSLEKLTKMMKT